MIENLTKEAKIGDIYTGKVVRIMGFGAFIQILPGQDGMVHISELSDHRVESVETRSRWDRSLRCKSSTSTRRGRYPCHAAPSSWTRIWRR